MTGILFLAFVLFAILAAWTNWSFFYGATYVAGAATVIVFIASLLRPRDREPRGAHSRR